MISLHVNGRNHEIEAKPEDLLAWVLQEKLGLTLSVERLFPGRSDLKIKIIDTGQSRI